ncbi:MAG: hypothetical protein ACJ73E_08275 [Mycobacteriales bacterium]
MDEDEGRALLAAYLPETEPEEPPAAGVVARARAVRRRRRTVLAGAASVAAVLVASAIAVGAHPSAAPPTGPAPTASPTAPPTPSGPHCRAVFRDGKDAGARAWARWVRGELGLPAGPVPSWWGRECAEQKDSGFVPTHTHNQAEIYLPDRAPPGERPEPGAQTLTATITRWERLPDSEPCQNSEWIEYVACRRSTLPDGSLVDQRDFYYEEGRQAGREAYRVYPDGRAVGLFLTYTNPSPAEGAFERMARTLDELTAIVTDPAALRYLPRP